jgi:hypothetical protein
MEGVHKDESYSPKCRREINTIPVESGDLLFFFWKCSIVECIFNG